MKKFRIAALALMALVALVSFTGCSTLFGNEDKWTAVKDPAAELVGKWIAETASAETTVTQPATGKMKESAVITLDYSKKGQNATVESADIEAYTFDQALSDDVIKAKKDLESSFTLSGYTMSVTVDVSKDKKSLTIKTSASYETAVEEFVREMKGTYATVEINGKKNAFRVIAGGDEENALVFKKSK